MRYVILITISMLISINTMAQFKGLTSGKYVLSKNINTVNAKTNKPETITVIETLEITVKKSREIVITPTDSRSRYFTTAKGYADLDGNVQFGFTYAKETTIFSINYNGTINEEGYFKGKLICIYPTSETAIKGDWAMKKIDSGEPAFRRPSTGF